MKDVRTFLCKESQEMHEMILAIKKVRESSSPRQKKAA